DRRLDRARIQRLRQLHPRLPALERRLAAALPRRPDRLGDALRPRGPPGRPPADLQYAPYRICSAAERDRSGGRGVDFTFSPEERAFAEEVERFLDEHATPDVADVTRENMAQIVDTPARRAFMKKLAARGWL